MLQKWMLLFRSLITQVTVLQWWQTHCWVVSSWLSLTTATLSQQTCDVYIHTPLLENCPYLLLYSATFKADVSKLRKWYASCQCPWTPNNESRKMLNSTLICGSIVSSMIVSILLFFFLMAQPLIKMALQSFLDALRTSFFKTARVIV